MDGWPLFKISQPHESNDVLLSVDHGSNSHWNSTINGHERFLQIIQEHYQDYTSQSRLGKPKIALAILDKWRKQEPPGRFLKVVDNTNPPLWEDVGDKKALSCISKALKITSRWASEEKTTSLWDLLLDSLNLDRNREDKKKNALDWKNSKGLLYGREYQTQQLLAAYNRRRRSKPEDAPEIVLVSGPSGTGKTILANSIRKYVESDGGIFVFRKFDSRQQNATPLLAPFSAAFRGFTKQVKDRGEDTLTEMRKSIMDALGVEVQILADAIPSLRDFLGLESKGTTDTMIEEDHDSTEEYRLDLDVAEKRLRFISLWRRLMQAIASPERPIYLLADDLQWADPTSLEVIAGVLSPKLEQISGLMVLATVRGNDVSASDNLSRTLRVLEDQGTKITLIEVANLSVEHISSMLSDLLGRSTEDCLPLAEVVHAQTNGNPLFAREYLIQLNKDGILYRDHASGEWNWKEDEMIISLEEKGHSEMVVRLLARKLRQMPSYVLDMLKVASCLGDDFEEDMLCHSGFVVSSHVLLALEIAEEQNIIEYDYDRETGHFVHDKLRETAYSLIPSEEKTIFHLTIGRNLRKKLSVNNSVFTRHIFIVVDQMRYGDSLISNLEEKDDLSKLSLWASRAAAEMSAFAAAVEYADFGIKHLWQRHWRDQYGLSLDIYSTSIELAYCTGNLEKVDLLVKEVAVHARTFRDKQRALMTQVVAYGSRANAEKAIELCSEMLREVGEPFPIRFNLFQLILEYTRVRCKLMHMNEEDILSLKKLTDPKAMAQKQIIMLTYAPLLLSNYKVSPLPGFWLIRLSLKFGISSLSAIGFLLYGLVLGRMEKLEESYRMGQLALQILKKFPSKQLEARVMHLYWAFVGSSREPLTSVLNSQVEAHHLALRHGDTEVAMTAGVFSCILRIFIGTPLGEILFEVKRLEDLCLDYGQMKTLAYIASVEQVCCNLLGISDDPLVLTGNFVDENKLLKEMQTNRRGSAIAVILHLKYFLATYLNDFKSASALYKENKEQFSSAFVSCFRLFQVFYEGISFAGLSRIVSGSCRKRALADVQKRVKALNNFVVQCPENAINKLYLVKAELEFSCGRYTCALLNYSKAIDYAEREGFVCETALACEKAGLMLQKAGKSTEAVEYFRKARSLYLSWGATVKADEISRLLSAN